MTMRFPSFLGVDNDAQPSRHVRRVQSMPYGYSIPDHYFIRTDDDIETLVERAQSTLMEAHLVDRSPGCRVASPLIELDDAAARQAAKDNVKGEMKARKWAREAIDSGWY